MIGFRLNPDGESPDVFALIAYGDRDFPIQDDGRILFFSNPALALEVYQLCPEDVKSVTTPPSEVQLVCDVAGALHLIKSQDFDDSATVLNCLNTIFDLVASTGLSWPPNYQSSLHALADHLTFHRELTPFLGEQVSRTTAVDAFLWCIGAVTMNAKLIG
jgi:hypothetical protein